MKLTTALTSNERGAAAVEFALSVPVLVSMIWGIFQLALVFEANAGIQHALGEGARYATLYDTTTTNHVPTDARIKARMDARLFGPNDGTFTSTVTTPASTVCTSCKLLTVTYTRPMSFLFIAGPTITLNRTKQVYVVQSGTSTDCSDPSVSSTPACTMSL